ncbi:hypothetical protein BD414DRAFT_190378 [Trametes punicea]|nr:hypothetical protein BD414DRAFT_190378 [Trametes punicea]
MEGCWTRKLAIPSLILRTFHTNHSRVPRCAHRMARVTSEHSVRTAPCLRIVADSERPLALRRPHPVLARMVTDQVICPRSSNLQWHEQR